MPRPIPLKGCRFVGTIRTFRNRRTGDYDGYVFRHRFMLQNGRERTHTRMFQLKKYESDADCLEAAQAYQKNYCEERGYFVNVYWENEGVIHMQLNYKDGPLRSDICVKFDKEDLEHVVKYVWVVSADPSSGVHIAYSMKLRRTLGAYIMQLNQSKGKRRMCYYVNGNVLDCRRENLTSRSETAIRRIRNLDKLDNRLRTRPDGRMEFRYTENGKRKSVYFTAKEYGGEEGARRAAMDYINEYKRHLTLLNY